jgi:hypothetical protein
MRGLSFDQFRHRVDRLKVLELEVLIANGNLEVLLQKQDELHGKHGVDKTGGKDPFIVANNAAADMPPQKSPEFFFCLLHLTFVAVKSAPVFATAQTGIHHLLQQRTRAEFTVFELVVQDFNGKQNRV